MRPTDGWRLVAREDGSSSSSDPVEALLHMAWRSRHCAARRARVGSGRVDEAGPSTGHETTSPRTVLGITSRLEGRLADRPRASQSGEET